MEVRVFPERFIRRKAHILHPDHKQNTSPIVDRSSIPATGYEERMENG
jgi:hypothetical protein